MNKASFKVRIPYSGITELELALGEGDVQATVKRPLNQPTDMSQIVEIRVLADTQGKDHMQLIKERIEFNDGSIAGELYEEKKSFRRRVLYWLEEIWLTSVLSYAAIVTPVITNSPAESSLFNSNDLHLFLAVVIPIAIGIGSSQFITRK